MKLPVAQLYLRDIPLLRPPGQADLLQVLWCPYDHDPDYKPSTALFWRSAAEVVDILATPPEPYEVNCEGYVPEPCVAPRASRRSAALPPPPPRVLSQDHRDHRATGPACA
ncbi:hypothetical protein ACGFNV_36040 [Streptomyces sp. NPDC048751]|uniref:hypothetical protein n=1 Tax=Streptomyces sp. NPDC048751 TaxID=3365591 RepID=UPI003720543E